MIVPDGRMDLEKLEELLGNPEETHLDLKVPTSCPCRATQFAGLGALSRRSRSLVAMPS
jgi:hypothetical protein